MQDVYKRQPMGIWLNTPGSVIKISDGPLPASIPKANTAGMMASPESRAASVSNRAVRMEAPGISTLLSRYAPYTIMPEPVIDSEKKACPMAITQVSTRSSASPVSYTHLDVYKRQGYRCCTDTFLSLLCLYGIPDFSFFPYYASLDSFLASPAGFGP